MSVPHLTTADYEQKVGDYKNVDKWSFKGERPCLVDFYTTWCVYCKNLNPILDDLKKYGTVTVDKDMCIICVVGDLEWENVGFEAKALDAMRDIPVRMISFGGSNYNISFLIRDCDKKTALQSLSDMLFNNK